MAMLAGQAGQMAQPGGPSSATQRGDFAFDSSGWNVNFGSGAIEATRSQNDAGGVGQYLPFVLAGVGLLIVWRMTRKK